MEYLAHHSVQHTESMNLPLLVVLTGVAIMIILIALRGRNEG